MFRCLNKSGDPQLDYKHDERNNQNSSHKNYTISISINYDIKRVKDTSALDALASCASTVLNLTDSNIKYFQNSKVSPEDKKKFKPASVSIQRGRVRSDSNPEGMEKWDSYTRGSRRRRFFLPNSILEKELANIKSVCENQNVLKKLNGKSPNRVEDLTASSMKGSFNIPSISIGKSITIDSMRNCNISGTFLNNNVLSIQMMEKNITTFQERIKTKEKYKGLQIRPESVGCDIYRSEFLNQARCSILSDFITKSGPGSIDLPLPHTLDKYKEVYNKNGRIGIYTPAERAQIIAKFNHKRSKRVWKKKIRYNCRKNLADRRMRIKGRFVKCSMRKSDVIEKPTNLSKSIGDYTHNSLSHIISNPFPTLHAMDNKLYDSDMTKNDLNVDFPNVDDPEACFKPTDSQPYRRVRRHTII